MIKKILKYGAVAGVSYAAGAMMQAIYGSKERKESSTNDDTHDVWQGEKHEITVSAELAGRMVGNIDETIANDKCTDAIFCKDDLQNIRTRLMYADIDENEEGKDLMTIEVTDRERLRLIEHTVLDTENNMFIPNEYK